MSGFSWLHGYMILGDRGKGRGVLQGDFYYGIGDCLIFLRILLNVMNWFMSSFFV